MAQQLPFNPYRLEADHAVIIMVDSKGRPNGTEVLVDFDSLRKLIEDNRRWSIRKQAKTGPRRYDPSYTDYCKSTANTTRSFEYLHRFLTNCPKGLVVDHINGNGLDNRLSNLRVVTQKENLLRGRPGRANRSGYRGVEHRPRNKTKPYYASVRTLVNGKIETLALGYHPTAEEAARVYDEFALYVHGPLARLNFPQDNAQAAD